MSVGQLVPALIASALTMACYGELEGEDQYRQLRIDEFARVPNQPPGSGGATAPPATGTPTGMPSTTAPPTTSNEPPPEPVMLPEGCVDVPGTLFGMDGKCGGAACHGGPSQAPLLYSDLGYSVDDIFTRLLNLPGTATSCPDNVLIDPNNVEESLLITKLSDSPPCGTKMPLTGSITPEESECIKAWTRAVAAGQMPP